MARIDRDKANNVINIKSVPIQNNIGAYKFVNDDWGTMAFSIPRNQIQNRFVDTELKYNFIYFLFGYKDNKEVVYIGQAKKRNDGESVLKRLREHDKNTAERYWNKWSWIVAVTNKNDAWGLDDLNALEHAFYNIIPSEQRLNGNNPNSGGANYEAYNDKINQIKNLITAIGFNIFSNDETEKQIQITSEINENTIVEDLQHGMARIPEIVTPRRVVKTMVDMLPTEVWNSKTKFLDPACKGGEYLREIYDRLMDCEIMQSEFPNTIERSNHILKNQIYGIALSQVSLERTTKKLLGEDRNIRVINNYISILKGISKYRLEGMMEKLIHEEFGKDMKFDVVIGNPPYQESNGGGNGSGGTTLYSRFIDGALDTADTICMITKDNWMQSEQLKSTRDNMIKAGIVEIKDYPKIHEVFNGVDVAVSIFLIRKGFNGLTKLSQIKDKEIISTYNKKLHGMKYIPNNEIEFSIYDKVCMGDSFNIYCKSNTPFGIRTNGNVGGDEIDQSVIQHGNYDVPILYMNKGRPTWMYTTRDSIPRKGMDIIDEYKVVCGQQFNKNETVITSISGLKPGAICSSSYGVLYSSKNKSEAINAYKYIKTRLFRYLVRLMIDTVATISASRVQLVPLQDFTSNSDIDWSQSISDIDRQLYRKYGLSPEEIEYIEKTIKSMDNSAGAPKEKTKLTAADVEANYVNNLLGSNA